MAAAEKKGVKVTLVASKDLSITLDHGELPLADRVVLQRCVSYFRNVHSTAALESAGHRVVNSFACAWGGGTKLFGAWPWSGTGSRPRRPSSPWPKARRSGPSRRWGTPQW